MDPRRRLLMEFFNSMQKNKLKLEINRYGFDFLDKFSAAGIILEYGQLTPYLIHRYRFVNVPEQWLEELLQWHLDKQCNICLYFNETANNVCCFNLDNIYRGINTPLIPEIEFSVNILSEYLAELGMEPLVVISGRGYHLWCRFAAVIDNRQLFDFMIRMQARTLAALNKNKYDYHKIKINIYPNSQIANLGSLRLFGSEHIRCKIFSYVRTPTGMLDEAGSWQRFTDYLENRTIPVRQFQQAYDQLMVHFSNLY